MRQILFNNNATVPGAIAFENLVAGRIYAFDADNMTTSLPLGTLTTAERVVFVQGGLNAKHIFSPVIDVAAVRNAREVPYEAPVAQVTTIVPVVGIGEAEIKIVEVSAGFKPHKRATANVRINDLTKEQITDKFVALLNKQYPKFFTASKTGTDITITGNLFVSFETALDGVAIDWSRTVTTTPIFGTGTPQQAAAKEEEAWGANVLNRTYLPLTPERYAANQNYEFHQFEFKTTTTPNISLGNSYGEITIATSVDATGINLNTFFGI